MARSVWKGPFVDNFLILAVKKAKASGSKNIVIKTWSRRSTIMLQFVGLVFQVYNGKKFVPVKVTESMVGKKFGCYSPTRTFYGHGADKKAKR